MLDEAAHFLSSGQTVSQVDTEVRQLCPIKTPKTHDFSLESGRLTSLLTGRYLQRPRVVLALAGVGVEEFIGNFITDIRG